MFTKLIRRAAYIPKRVWLSFGIIITSLILTDRFAPVQHIPWKPLDMEAPTGLATRTKITLLSFAPSTACLGKLTTAQHLNFVQADAKKNGKCGWTIATTMTRVGHVTFKPSEVTSQCPLMIASYIWLHEVDKAAQKRLGSRLKTIHHAGTYSCRRQRGNGSSKWSEHAFANAWDITGFELNDGRVISVLKHWRKNTSQDSKAKAKFLLDARRSACRVFRVVLTPDFNAAHKDHFHLDQGPSLSCS